MRSCAAGFPLGAKAWHVTVEAGCYACRLECTYVSRERRSQPYRETSIHITKKVV